MKWLIGIPIYNEAKNIRTVLEQALSHNLPVVVVNDGSTDETGKILEEFPQCARVTHARNRGYGAALCTLFRYAKKQSYEYLITMDCDGQHEPERIPLLKQTMELTQADIVSASRYLEQFASDQSAPMDRRRTNQLVTEELNRRYQLGITDAFCGFKAYRTAALERMCIHETGWGMPLELWVQASYLKLKIVEVPIPRLYLDPSRAFGGVLNDAEERLKYYHKVIEDTDARIRQKSTQNG
ncbi:MAG: glycosyltransferase family 2 protein [Zavarzinella sp.]